jgi:hypothetical protein
MGNTVRSRKFRWLAWRLLPAVCMAVAAVAALLGRDWPAAVVGVAATGCLVLDVQLLRLWYRIGYLSGAARASGATLQAIATADDPERFTARVLDLIDARAPEPWNWRNGHER